jgi:hypothetical protein
MPDLARLAGTPYLQGNPAFAHPSEQKRDGLFGAIAHAPIGLGSGCAGMGGPSCMASVAFKLRRRRNVLQGNPYLQMGGS